MRTQPFLDEVLRVGAKAEHEIPLSLQLVDGLNGLMDLGTGVSDMLCPWGLFPPTEPEILSQHAEPEILSQHALSMKRTGLLSSWVPEEVVEAKGLP